LRGEKDRIEIGWNQRDQRPQLVDKKDAPTVTGVVDDFIVSAG